ncbi:hypothetical protein [Prosthecobacter sp. SYSU 5D2]|uniref:hypothetical protein n=1 Tax=Prosthecobacter sp. SYSU 5D2 TaxID=3134134 RepID=UPI0031FE44EC
MTPASPSSLQPITAPAGERKESVVPSVKAPVKEAVVKVPRRRSAIDTLVARDKTAVFWFLVACVVASGCAWYLVIMAEVLKARPPFVVMDTAGAYYVAPGLNFDSMKPMHVDLTMIAVETMFERGPEGLYRGERVDRLFNRQGKSMLQDILKKEDSYFLNQKVEQTVELEGEPKLTGALSTAAATVATGLVTRRGFFKGQAQVESYRFKVAFIWRMNPNMRGNRLYPAVIDKISTYSLEKISE